VLSEKQFIQEAYKRDPYPFRFWSVLIALSIFLIYGAAQSAEDLKVNVWKMSPFLRVSNREFSLFLWQHPHLMRPHAKNKIGYLPGFQYLHKINMDIETAEEYVAVPPNVLFLYHTWNRLLKGYLPSRAIFVEEFKEFLTLSNEWHPSNWIKAPKKYFKLVQDLDNLDKSLNLVSFSELPFDVRQAFYGWKNYFKEGEAINSLRLTGQQVKAFLEKNPNFKKNYWEKIYPNYLITFDGNFDIIPRNQIPSFLLSALYNDALYFDLTNPSE